MVIECEYIEETWLGSFNVVGGLDCDDADGAVYPTAVEVCDGQFNDCSNNYVENSAPVDELDDDGDGWIECSRDIDVVWEIPLMALLNPTTMGTVLTVFCLAPVSVCVIRHLVQPLYR